MKIFKKKPVRVNCQTVDNLINYLKSFPGNAKVVIHSHSDKLGYFTADCKIAINFEHQKETNTVMFLLGDFIEKS